MSAARRGLRPEPPQLARLAGELRQACAGAVVQDCRLAGEDLPMLELRVPGQSLHLALSLHPPAAGPLLLKERPRRDPAWESGTNFWQLLRSALPASVLEDLRAPPGERTLLLDLRRGAERLVLAAAFHGARPNLVLYRDGAAVADLLGRVSRGSGVDELLRSPAERPSSPGGPLLGLEQWSLRLGLEREASLSAGRIERLSSLLEKAGAAARTRAQRRRLDAEGLGDRAALRTRAEALSAHLHLVGKGDEELLLAGWPDPESDEELRIPLDRTRDPSANLERLWQRVRKAERGHEETLARVKQAENQAAALEELAREARALASTVASGEEVALEGIEALEAAAALRLPKARSVGPTRKGETPALPYRRFTSHDGLPILVGRSSKANDELSFRVASGNDLWLHARGVAGSHVVVKLPKGAELPQETLLDAATLAHVFSKRKADSHGEVTWCRAKHVSKRKGMPPGQVLVSQEKSLRVRVEPERLERLKASEEAG